jgi:hypothetical protein
MFLLLVLAASAVVAVVFTVRAVITDGPQRVQTHDNMLAR